MAQYYILDTETASLSGGVCEIAWLLVDDDLQILETFHSRVNPERPIDAGAHAIHGISDADVADKPTMAEIAKYVKQPVNLICHNVQFDKRMIQPHIETESSLCTLRLARKYLPKSVNHKLPTLVELLGIDAGEAHTALGDVQAVYGLLKHLLTLAGAPLSTLMLRAEQPKMIHKMPFGKYKHSFVMDVPPDYRRWLLQQPGVDQDIVYTFKKLEGIL